LKDHLRTRLAPCDRWIEPIYGVDIETIITEIGKILEHEKTGVLNRYVELARSEAKVRDELRKKGYVVGEGASEEDVERV
jgi:hypothetical protein